NETLKFEVVDTGIGISQEEIDVIFEEFRQSNSSKSQRRGGTGLGLAISNKLAEIMGGNLDVKSEINQGSTFIFSVPFNQVKVFKKDDKQEGVDIIPVSKDDNRPLLITDQPSELISSVKFETVDNEPVVIQPVNEVSELEIMIVDDDPNTLFTLAEIVQEANCNPIIVHNGKECLELLETKIPDLILLDIIMPEMDGFKTIQQIKKNNKWSNIPVIAVTAKAMDEDHKIILKHGFTDYIPKPVNPTFVEQKIQQLITQLKTI
ncbi:MAG: response regulator, partial [Ignavibacteriaceae bacterium]|nr:response regulator [Ignavibacteriaceae bacterium]